MTTPAFWYVLAVRGAAEDKARRALEEKEFEVFLPTYKRLKSPSRHARGKRAKKLIEETVLLRGYLFARMRPDKLAQVTHVAEVHSVLKVNDKPARVADSVIEALEHHCAMGTYDDVQEIKLYAGDRIIVSSGPMEGFTGTVVQQPGSENRVDVEINGFKFVSSLDNLRKLADQRLKGDSGSVSIPNRDERRTDPAETKRSFPPRSGSMPKSSKEFT